MRHFSTFLTLLLVVGCHTRARPDAAGSAAPVGRTAPDAPLSETRWVLRQLNSKPVSVPADTREAYLTLRANGAAEGNGGCNRFRGNYFSETPNALIFSPLMSTRMACPAMETENGFTQALGQARTYRISGDTLWVLGAGAAPLARLEAVYL